MFLRAVYTVEAALVIPIILIILLGVFQVSGDLYQEGKTQLETLEAQEQETEAVKTIRNYHILTNKKQAEEEK